MMLTSSNQTMKMYDRRPSAGQKSGLFYTYIFEKHQLSNLEIKLITKKHKDTHFQMNVLGHSLDEYLEIQKIIKENANVCHKQPHIILVTSCKLAEQILTWKAKNGGLDIFSQIFLCFQSRQQPLAKQLKIKYNSKVNPSSYQLRQIIDYLENARQKLSFQSSIFKNFYQMNQDNKQFSSLRARLRLLACYNILPNEYEAYLQKFQKYLKQIYKIKNSMHLCLIMNQLQKCIQFLKSQQIESFCLTILKLYQDGQVQFYKIINEAALRLCQQSFEFQMIALPLSFLFKGIKIEYNHKLEIKIAHQLFKDRDFITLYRLAKIQKDQIISLASKKGCYFQNLSVLSTSITQKGALKFLVHRHKEKFNYALLEIKLPRYNHNQIELMLPFLRSSLAFTPNNNQQKEIVLNCFSVFTPNNLSEISIANLRTRYSKLSQTNDWQSFGNFTKLPIIEMELINFQHQIVNFNENLQSMSEQQRSSIQNYIIGGERLSKIQNYCMADAYLDEKRYQKCRSQNKKKQLQLLHPNPSVISEVSNLDEVPLIKHKLRLQKRNSDCAYGSGDAKEAISSLKKVFSLHQDLSTKDKSISLMQHTQNMNATAERFSKICSDFKKYEDAKTLLSDRIDLLKIRIGAHQNISLRERFQLVGLLNILAIYYFKRNQIGLARKYLQDSKRELNFILKQLDYEKLKKQTFYILWIVHFFLKDQSSWKTKEIFQKQKRSQNIAQVTKNFGIGNGFQDVVQNSRQLEQSILDFLNRRKQAIENSKLTKQQKQQQKYNLFQEVEDQFKDHRLTHELKPKIEVFFQSFQKSKKNLEETVQGGINKKLNELQRMIIINCSTSTGIKFEEQYKKINDLKIEIINQKIVQWLNKKKSSEPILDIRDKIDSLIISLRYNYFHLYRKQVRKDYKTVKKLMDDTTILIQKHLDTVRKFTGSNPSFKDLSEESKLCQIYLQRQKFIESEEKLSNLIGKAKKNPFYSAILFEAYEKLIFIYEQKADMSYFNELSYINKIKNIPLKRQIKTVRKQIVKKGVQFIKEALDKLKELSKRSVIQEITEQIDGLQIKFRLILVKFDILGSKLQSDTKAPNRLAKQCQLLESKIGQSSLLIESACPENSQIINSYKAAHLYNQSIFYSDIKRKQSLLKMKQSLIFSCQTLHDIQKIKVLCTGLFLFSKFYNGELDMFAKDLMSYEQQMENYGCYWKISLSLYIYFKFKRDIPKQLDYICRTYDFMRNNQQTKTPIFKAIEYEYKQALNINPNFSLLTRPISDPIVPKLQVDAVGYSQPLEQINQATITPQIDNLEQNKPKEGRSQQRVQETITSPKLAQINPQQSRNYLKQNRQNKSSGGQQQNESSNWARSQQNYSQRQEGQKYYSFITKKGIKNKNQLEVEHKYQKPITEMPEVNDQDRSLHSIPSVQNNMQYGQLIQDEAEQFLRKSNRARSSLFAQRNRKTQQILQQPAHFSHITKLSKKIEPINQQIKVPVQKKEQQYSEQMGEI